MPALETASKQTGDDLDDLYNYDIDADDAFRDFDADLTVPKSKEASKKLTTGTVDDVLGIKGEVKVAKKRAPVAKLDEDRLLSQAGIPKLRRITKERLKFKGKGHEFSDVARMLNLYQLWLDDLFPRAKFADGLAMIEKLGHSKRIQIMRREWINEGKPRDIWEQDQRRGITSQGVPQETSREISSPVPATNSEKKAAELPITHSIHPDSTNPDPITKQQNRREADTNKIDSTFFTDEEEGQPEDDELDALLAEGTLDQPTEQSKTQEHPNDDELDALLAEDVEMKPNRQPGNKLLAEQKKSQPTPTADDEFADEMEAMAEMDDMW
ncbi:MAG: chromosome segregation in meiosis- protein [Icmadophila ericetorum]|nr:chromosome segregation in meiosis- protein [Icmadophila ericetorum]